MNIRDHALQVRSGCPARPPGAAGRPPAGRRAPRSAALALALLAGCAGTEMDPGALEEQPATGYVERPKVTLPAPAPKLLPFDVRLQRIAAGAGVPASDRVFDAAREQRLALGGHDFANGIAPDLQWNAQRMAAWVAAMLPVCRDTRVRSHLGEWRQGGVEKFAQGALGRASTADDLADLSTTLALSGDDGWVATCLSLVSSAEVLLQ